LGSDRARQVIINQRPRTASPLLHPLPCAWMDKDALRSVNILSLCKKVIIKITQHLKLRNSVADIFGAWLGTCLQDEDKVVRASPDEAIVTLKDHGAYVAVARI